MVLSIRLDEETVAEVDKLAAAEGRSRSNLLVRLIKAALEARLGKRPAKRPS